MIRLNTSRFASFVLIGVAMTHCTTVAIGQSAKKGSAKPPAVGEIAPDFSLKTASDEEVQLSRLIKDGPVVVVVLRGFPGYQCPICNAQAGQFLGKAKQFAEAKARVIFVYPGPADDLKKHAEDFIRGKTLPENFYLVLDPDFKFTTAYRLRWDAKNETAYPSTFIVGPDQNLQFAKISQTHGDRAAVEEVLGALK